MKIQMRNLISSFILISSMSSVSIAGNNTKKVSEKVTCIELFEICVEIRKSIIIDMQEHNASRSDMIFMMPEYTDQQCIADLIEKEKAGECK